MFRDEGPLKLSVCGRFSLIVCVAWAGAERESSHRKGNQVGSYKIQCYEDWCTRRVSYRV